MNLQEYLKMCVENAENEKSKITDDILAIEGMSGAMTRHFYNNLLSMEGARYLEIGTYLGSSTCAAMYGNRANIVCIDNWSEFNEGEKDIRAGFLANLEKYKGENTVSFKEADCFSVDVATLPKFNIYLYDGPHEVEHHYKALKHYYDCLDDEFIFICDDWDWANVRKGTYQAIEECGLEIVFSIERSLQEGENYKPFHYAKATWWNGMWAAVLRKTKNR